MKPHDPVRAEFPEEIRIFDRPGRFCDHLQDQMLRALIRRRAEGGGVEHGDEATVGSENRRGAAAEPVVRGPEMLAVMNRDQP